MARIDWAVLCDLAFFDRQDRLCLVGIIRSLSAPRLPSMLHQATLVARLTDIRPVDEVAISVGMVTPAGRHEARTGSDCVSIDVVREYVLATLRTIPLRDEGVHRFQIRLRGQPIVSLDIPVLAAGAAAAAAVQ